MIKIRKVFSSLDKDFTTYKVYCDGVHIMSIKDSELMKPQLLLVDGLFSQISVLYPSVIKDLKLS